MKYNNKWDLSQLGFQSETDDKIKINFHLYKSNIEEFEKKWNIDTNKVLDKFELYLKDINEINKTNEFWVYLSLLGSLCTTNQQVNKVTSELSLLSEPLSNLLIFTDRINKEIGSEKLKELSTSYIDFSNMLLNISNNIKYLLSDKEEKVSMMIANSLSDDIYEQYLSSLEFDFNGKLLSYQEIWSKRTSNDRDERKLAFDILLNEFSKEKNKVLFDNIYSKICKSNTASMRLRNIENVMDSRNISEEMENEDVNFILEKVYNKYHLYSKYLKIKNKILNLDKLEVYDILAPITSENEKEMTFEEGSEFYLKTIKKIDNDIYNHSLGLYNQSRIDANPTKGKTGGAFCSYTKGNGEWVLLNWDNTPGYVTTLAHELGHAYHGHLSNKQNYINYSSSLCLAETASIFNETVMFNALLEETENKQALIANRLDDLFSTIFRQVAYVRFEKKCHESWKNNIPLSHDDYSNFWLEEMKDLYGDSININEDFIKYGWMNIPHIYHTPFYCYAYSFGNILSLNIYQGYINSSNKEEYMSKYKEFLSLGGSKRPKDAIKEIFNININTDEFYDLAFFHIEDLIKQLEESL